MTDADLKFAVANEPTPVGLTVETVVSVSETLPPPPPEISTVAIPELASVVTVPIPGPIKSRKVTPKPIVVLSLLIPIPDCGNPLKLEPSP